MARDPNAQFHSYAQLKSNWNTPLHGKIGHVDLKTHLGHKGGKVLMVEIPNTLNLFNNIINTGLNVILHPNLYNVSNHPSNLN